MDVEKAGYGTPNNVESVDTRNRDGHMARFREEQALRIAAEKKRRKAWADYTAGRGPRPECPPAVERVPERQEIEPLGPVVK